MGQTIYGMGQTMYGMGQTIYSVLFSIIYDGPEDILVNENKKDDILSRKGKMCNV